MHFYIYNAQNLRQDTGLRSIAGKALRRAKLGSLRLKQGAVSETYDSARWSLGAHTKPAKDR